MTSSWVRESGGGPDMPLQTRTVTYTRPLNTPIPFAPKKIKINELFSVSKVGEEVGRAYR